MRAVDDAVHAGSTSGVQGPGTLPLNDAMVNNVASCRKGHFVATLRPHATASRDGELRLETGLAATARLRAASTLVGDGLGCGVHGGGSNGRSLAASRTVTESPATCEREWRARVSRRAAALTATGHRRGPALRGLDLR
eukprot:5467330-Prymnesium_polylepis.1